MDITSCKKYYSRVPTSNAVIKLPTRIECFCLLTRVVLSLFGGFISSYIKNIHKERQYQRVMTDWNWKWKLDNMKSLKYAMHQHGQWTITRTTLHCLAHLHWSFRREGWRRGQVESRRTSAQLTSSSADWMGWCGRNDCGGVVRK